MGNLARRTLWMVPLVLALIAVGCASGGDSFGSGGEVTVPVSRPSPGGPTTTRVESNGRLFERTPVLPADLLDYSASLPPHFTGGADSVPDNTPADNPVSDAGATLGRVLFYDVNLSETRGLACASCHLQSNSFTDRTPLSLGNLGQTTRRNSMSLANLAFNENGRFFWDERAASLEIQALGPFEDPVELHLTSDQVTARILSLRYYEPLFVDAFGPGGYAKNEITLERVAQALAQFMRSMVSADAPYDRARTEVGSSREDFPDFSDEENLGKRLFFAPVSEGGGGCAGCHVTEAFLTPDTLGGNNGLDDDAALADLGVFEITGQEAQRASFRVSSLRNVAVTGPYMHDGRFRTLADVIDHYSENIAPHPNLSVRLQDDSGDPIRLSFSIEEKAALVAFLETLTDTTFLTDERFSDPFR